MEDKRRHGFKEPTELSPGRILIPVVALIVIIWLLASTIVIIDAGERGVLLTWGKAHEIPLEAGLHFKVPIQDNVVHVDVRTQKVVADASAASSDLQIVTTEVALNYHVAPGAVAIIYTELGGAYAQRIIDPAIQESVKQSTAKFTAEELITKRELVKQAIDLELDEILARYNIIVDETSITNFEFSPGFSAAIEMKVTAEQQALKAENDLKRIEVEAQQKIAQAHGESESILKIAHAEAEAIRIKGEALQKNPKLVDLEAVYAWNGDVPLITGGGTVPFIDMTGILASRAI